MNLSGYVGHTTLLKFNVHYCVLFSSMVRVRIRFSVWLVNCYAHICAIVGCNCHTAIEIVVLY